MAEEPSVDDRQLLHRMRRGDESAFEALYDRHQGPIFRFVFHMTGSRTMAEEITQEVFMLLIRKPGAYDASKGSLAAYMFGAARNLARRAVRKESVEVFMNDPGEMELVESPNGGIEEILSNAESLDLLRRGLLGLPEQYREVVVLCDLEEMSYEQASRVIECPAGTVASRLNRAHALLRAKLGRVVTGLASEK